MTAHPDPEAAGGSASPLAVFDVIAPVPAILDGFRSSSIIGRAVADGLIELNVINLRDFAEGKHRVIDDRPFGGGAGMLLKPEPLFAAIEARIALSPPGDARVLVLSPAGTRFRQSAAEELGRWLLADGAPSPGSPGIPPDRPPRRLLLVCGRYEGIDQRVLDHFQPELVSLGDFVIAGGEVAAMAVIEAVARLLPGVLGNTESIREESFAAATGGGLEYPQYTRPASFRGYDVPEVLTGGNHAAIEAWRRERCKSRG